MGSARDELLDRIVDDVAHEGIGDRSLRDLASAVGSSHRMLLYHFGSRAGLVAAIVDRIEEGQRASLAQLAQATDDPSQLVRDLWAQVSSDELLPFVRLFFESVSMPPAERGAHDLTDPWVDDAAVVSARVGLEHDPVDIRLGVAVTRGLLIDVLTTGQREQATAAIERFIELWEADRRRADEDDSGAPTDPG